MAITSRFSFVGTPVIPKAESKRPFCREFKGGNNKSQSMASMNFGVKESDSNMVFVEVFGSIQDTIQTMSADNEKIQVSWGDRFDEDVVNSVANYRRHTVDLGDDFGGRKEFISQYDTVQHLKEWLPKYKGKIVATGQFVKEWYKDQYYDKFKLQSVYATPEDTKSRLSLTVDIYYNKDSIDKADFKENKKIYLNGYVSQYINKDEGNRYIPQQFVFNTSKYDLEGNEKHKSLYDYKLRYIEVKNKTMVHIPWDVVLIRGAEGVEFDESMLTSAQKEQIELGIKTVDDFRPRGQIFGDKVNEYRLFDPKLTGDFVDGLVDTEMKVSEFEEEVYVPARDENIEDVMKQSSKSVEKNDKPPFEPDDVEIDDEDLF